MHAITINVLYFPNLRSKVTHQTSPVRCLEQHNPIVLADGLAISPYEVYNDYLNPYGLALSLWDSPTNSTELRLETEWGPLDVTVTAIPMDNEAALYLINEENVRPADLGLTTTATVFKEGETYTFEEAANLPFVWGDGKSVSVEVSLVKAPFNQYIPDCFKSRNSSTSVSGKEALKTRLGAFLMGQAQARYVKDILDINLGPNGLILKAIGSNGATFTIKETF